MSGGAANRQLLNKHYKGDALFFCDLLRTPSTPLGQRSASQVKQTCPPLTDGHSQQKDPAEIFYANVGYTLLTRLNVFLM